MPIDNVLQDPEKRETLKKILKVSTFIVASVFVPTVIGYAKKKDFYIHVNKFEDYLNEQMSINKAHSNLYRSFLTIVEPYSDDDLKKVSSTDTKQLIPIMQTIETILNGYASTTGNDREDKKSVLQRKRRILRVLMGKYTPSTQ